MVGNTKDEEYLFAKYVFGGIACSSIIICIFIALVKVYYAPE